VLHVIANWSDLIFSYFIFHFIENYPFLFSLL